MGTKAAQQANRPDVGVFAGCTYQKGNAITPVSNPYAGVSLKWNIQDVFSNREIVSQRRLVNQKARENDIYTKQQVAVSVEKSHRKMKQQEN